MKDKSNLIDYDCGCAIEYDGGWRGCFKHWNQAVTKERERKEEVISN